MPILHQFDYLFAIGTLAALLDAYNIGANDVANSFATSVASKSLTLRQACMAAAVFEFLGAVLVGARVAGTIRNGIIPLAIFKDNAGVQLLAFTVALSTSASWLMAATRYSFPVSTTYSIVSALAGVGVAIGGVNSVSWGWNGGKGLATIFAGFIISPLMSAGFAALVFLLTKYTVLKRKDSVTAALWFSPVFFFGVSAILTMSIIYKGAPSLNLQDLGTAGVAAATIGTGAVVAVLATMFWLPYVRAKVVKNDYTIRPYHFFYGPFLWNRRAPEDAGQIGAPDSVPDYRLVKEDRNDETMPSVNPPEFVDEKFVGDEEQATPPLQQSALATQIEKVDEHPIVGPWIFPRNLWIIARYKTIPFLSTLLTHGTSVDVHSLQAGTGVMGKAENIAKMHATAMQYDNKTEHLYSFVQVLTACTASFAHGSNDVANAIGPYAAIYAVWSSGSPAAKNAAVPVWILVVGGAMIVIGLATYGYNIMRVLGNRLTLHSPSRGFSMELGSAITVLLASQYGIPVSTTMCITGATMGVALCNGDLRSFNWGGLAYIVLGWVLTVPIVGALAGCLMAIILYAPHFV